MLARAADGVDRPLSASRHRGSSRGSHNGGPEESPIARRGSRVGRRPALEVQLAELRDVARDPSSDVARERLRAALADRSPHVVARAARIVSESRVAGFTLDLAAGFERFTVDGAVVDRGCGAKLAIVEALDALEHAGPEPFLRGARYEQLEGPTREDTAIGVRGRCYFALVRVRHPQVFGVMVDRVATSRHTAEWVNVARAVAYSGDPAGAPLLRLMWGQVHAGLVRDGFEVAVSALVGYLALDPGEGTALCRSVLLEREVERDDEVDRVEVVVLALAESRTAEAYGLVREWLDAHPDSRVRRYGFQALGLMRREEATAYLLAAIASGSAVDAEHAIAALAPFRHLGDVVRRVREAAAGNRAVELGAALARAFPAEEA